MLESKEVFSFSRSRVSSASLAIFWMARTSLRHFSWISSGSSGHSSPRAVRASWWMAASSGNPWGPVRKSARPGLFCAFMSAPQALRRRARRDILLREDLESGRRGPGRLTWPVGGGLVFHINVARAWYPERMLTRSSAMSSTSVVT